MGIAKVRAELALPEIPYKPLGFRDLSWDFKPCYSRFQFYVGNSSRQPPTEMSNSPDPLGFRYSPMLRYRWIRIEKSSDTKAMDTARQPG